MLKMMDRPQQKMADFLQQIFDDNIYDFLKTDFICLEMLEYAIQWVNERKLFVLNDNNRMKFLHEDLITAKRLLKNGDDYMREIKEKLNGMKIDGRNDKWIIETLLNISNTVNPKTVNDEFETALHRIEKIKKRIRRRNTMQSKMYRNLSQSFNSISSSVSKKLTFKRSSSMDQPLSENDYQSAVEQFDELEDEIEEQISKNDEPSKL